MTIRLLIHAGCALLALASAAACRLNAQAVAEGMFDRTLPVTAPVTLDVRTGAGSIRIQSGSADHVRVIGRIRGESWRSTDIEVRVRRIEGAPPIEQDGNTIHIGRVEDPQLFRNISIAYELTVPPDTRVVSRTGSGSQSISDLSGPIDVNSGSGGLLIRQIRGDVRASTGSGAIRAEDLGGSFLGRTSSGSIVADRVRGAVDARTGSGRVDVAQDGEADVDVATGSGGIGVRGASRALRARAASGRIDLEGRPGQNWDVASASGSIRIDFAEDAAFELNARTASGAIDTSHPLAVLDASRTRLRGTVRGGGPRVDVSTASGSIRIE